MADTFGKLWRQGRQECPAAPALLVRAWAQAAWRQALDAKDWSFLVGYGGWTTAAQTLGTATVTSGSTTVTLGTLTASASDVGRQFRLLNQPLYTILAVSGGLTLDRAYEGPTAALQDAQIVSAYATMPADFGRFDTAYAVDDRRPLHLFTTRAEVDRADAGRQMTDTPRYVVATSTSPVTATLGRTRYEFWPHATTARTFAWSYYKALDDPTDDYAFPGVWAQKSHVLLTGLLARAARWPGTNGQKNPYFNLALAKSLADQFTADLDDAMLTDENVDPSWILKVPLDAESASPYAALTPHPDYDDAW